MVCAWSQSRVCVASEFVTRWVRGSLIRDGGSLSGSIICGCVVVGMPYFVDGWDAWLVSANWCVLNSQISAFRPSKFLATKHDLEWAWWRSSGRSLSAGVFLVCVMVPVLHKTLWGQGRLPSKALPKHWTKRSLDRMSVFGIHGPRSSFPFPFMLCCDQCGLS